jgi:hypothetical protein
MSPTDCFARLRAGVYHAQELATARAVRDARPDPDAAWRQAVSKNDTCFAPVRASSMDVAPSQYCGR